MKNRCETRNRGDNASRVVFEIFYGHAKSSMQKLSYVFARRKMRRPQRKKTFPKFLSGTPFPNLK